MKRDIDPDMTLDDAIAWALTPNLVLAALMISNLEPGSVKALAIQLRQLVALAYSDPAEFAATVDRAYGQST